MTTLSRTHALVAELATVMGLPGLPPDDTGGFRLTVGEGLEVSLYGGDDEHLLIVAPVAPLPPEPGHALVLYLLRSNLFDSDVAPFQFAADEAGTLVFWGRIAIAGTTGNALAALIGRVADRAKLVRAEVEGA